MKRVNKSVFSLQHYAHQSVLSVYSKELVQKMWQDIALHRNNQKISEHVYWWLCETY